MLEDRIVAVATPPGEGGIGIIRMSGPGVIEVCQDIFLPYKEDGDLTAKPGFTLTLGWLLDQSGEKIDEVLLGIMRAPHSYTGEDVVEINCHGGAVPVRRCLQRCLQAGLRMAEPGEFTKRAFLNGRLELSQAEAVIDLIRAKNDRGMKLALQQLEGVNRQHFYEVEELLLRLQAMIDASLDFPEEVGELDYEQAESILTRAGQRVEQLKAAGQRADVYRQGIEVAICGKPNVGKSSLLNALARKERAIVTEIPGTTRDVIEEYLNIRGIPVKIMDTAGIRPTEDPVEVIGVERSRSAVARADLVLMVVDVGSGLTREDLEIFNSLEKDKLMVMVNKEDLTEKNISADEIRQLFKDITVIHGSVKEDLGLDELEAAVEEKIRGGQLPGDNLEIMLNERQQYALSRCWEQIKSLQLTLREVSLDCLAVECREALEAMGELSGQALQEAVIDKIFHEFCIGK